MIISFKGVNEIIKLTQENAELKRGAGDLLLILAIPDEKHQSLKNNDINMSYAIVRVMELIEENKKLKEILNQKP